MRVAWVGVNDAFIKAVEVSTIKALWLPCDPYEQQSIPLLKTVLPDLATAVCENCARMLERGYKLELDGFGDKRNWVRIAKWLASCDCRLT